MMAELVQDTCVALTICKPYVCSGPNNGFILTAESVQSQFAIYDPSTMRLLQSLFWQEISGG